MRILYTCQDISVTGGLERIISEKASAMAIRGNDVWLLVCNPPESSPAYSLDSRVHLVDLALPQPHGFIQKLLFKIRQNIKIRKAIHKIRPDITIAAPTWLTLSIIFKPRHLVLESHSSRSNMFSKEHHSLYKRLKVYIAERKADCVVTLTKGETINWPHARRIETIPNFITLDPKPINTIRSNRYMAIGRIASEKGFDMLIDAWAIVTKHYPEAIIDIFGEGEQRNVLEEKVIDLSLQNNVFFKGLCTDLKAVYESHAALVVSSHYEGFGLVIAEAMICGTPVIALDCLYGPHELINHNSSGILVPYYNMTREERVRGLADAICRLMDNSEERFRLGETGKTAAIQYLPKFIIPQWENLFHSISY